jgi:hypothetical protein
MGRVFNFRMHAPHLHSSHYHLSTYKSIEFEKFGPLFLINV